MFLIGSPRLSHSFPNIVGILSNFSQETSRASPRGCEGKITHRRMPSQRKIQQDTRIIHAASLNAFFLSILLLCISRPNLRILQSIIHRPRKEKRRQEDGVRKKNENSTKDGEKKVLWRKQKMNKTDTTNTPAKFQLFLRAFSCILAIKHT